MRQQLRVNLFRLWTVTGIVCFLLMLLHRSVPTTWFGRYSSTYALSLVIMLATILMAIIGWVLAERDLLPKIPSSKASMWGIVVLCLIGIVLFWLFMPGAKFLPVIALFRIYIVAVVAGLTLFYLLDTEQVQISLPSSVWTILLFAGAILALILTVLYIGDVPDSLYFDEPLLANYGWTCAEESVLGVEMLPPRNTGYLKVATPLAYCVPGFLMKVFGTSLIVARSSGILILWLAVPFIYWMARRLYGREAATIAAIIMLLFPLSHNHLRGDPYVAFVIAIALYCYTRAKEKPALWLHFVVGLCVASAIDGHQLGIRFIPVFGLLYVWQYLLVIREQKRFVWHRPFFVFAIGGFAYAGIFYLIHIVWWANTDLVGALDLVNIAYDEQLTVGGNVGFWERIFVNISESFIGYGVRHPVEVMLLFVGFIAAIWRFNKSDRLVLFVLVSEWLLLMLISPKPTPYYWVHHLPMIAVLAGGFVQSLVNNNDNSRVHLATIFPALLVMVFFTAHILLASQSNQNADRVMAISFDIDDNLPDDLQVITGHQVYFYGLAQRDFYDSNTFATLSVADAVEQWDIDSPQAIVRTLGLDEHPALREYIQTQEMVAVRCYQTNFFGRQTILYVLPEFAEQIPEQVCS